MSSVPAPPLPASDTDPQILQAAERRAVSKKSFSPFKRVKQGSLSGSNHPPAPAFISRHVSQAEPDLVVDIGDSLDELPLDRDVYRWAVLYENQRGLTILSTQLYSSLSLLPTDPPPFTIPEGACLDKSQPELSFSEYPLPDGSWEWVSSAWMIDMRDDGEVSYDGFEYNWIFRRHHWRPDCRFGGFVRRRRFVRLMVRRAKALRPHAETNTSLAQSSSRSTTSFSLTFDRDHALALAQDVWKGDENDWNRCSNLMRYVIRDGMRLEMWRTWLGVTGPTPDDSRSMLTPMTDGTMPPSESITAKPFAVEVEPAGRERPPTEWVAAVVREHYEELFAQFVYPESRAELAKLLAERVGMDVLPANGHGQQIVDFYSYSTQLSMLSGTTAE
ncbi:hypothetical protein K488DRAFT_85181 [Vararia minispora EC-137]|uniref:Uncharacterized protein n=1 Tax=Vararia minispora EC-137 TaxID=1314806 RepID=A0ACB8QMV3_9AGAM|nr:hypothetical protein K488DRAFT_85181 [Vararia minispora EC-137]